MLCLFNKNQTNLIQCFQIKKYIFNNLLSNTFRLFCKTILYNKTFLRSFISYHTYYKSGSRQNCKRKIFWKIFNEQCFREWNSFLGGRDEISSHIILSICIHTLCKIWVESIISSLKKFIFHHIEIKIKSKFNFQFSCSWKAYKSVMYWFYINVPLNEIKAGWGSLFK